MKKSFAFSIDLQGMGHPYSTLLKGKAVRGGSIYVRFDNHHIGHGCVLAGV